MTREENIKRHNEQQTILKDKRLNECYEMAINSANGITVKEVCITFKVSSTCARRYLKELMEKGLVREAGKDGHTVIFKANDGQTTDSSKAVMEVANDGKEFEQDSYIPCTDNCKPGDIIWISSRSGGGAFFRYLIITPWEHKAMVLGICSEEHPMINLNDPYYVFVGNDPETGKKLYADIRNNCQRGYKQFGERVMHVDQDSFDIVKARLARSMGISTGGTKSADPQLLREIEDWKKRYKKQAEEASQTINKLTYERDRDILDEQTKRTEVEEKYDDLMRDYKAVLQREEEANKRWQEAHEMVVELGEERDRLYEQLNATTEKTNEVAVSVNQELVVDLQSENERLKEQLVDLSMQLASDSAKIAAYEKHDDTLTKLLFCMIKGGKND